MATFLLYWNPYFSSYKMERFLEDFEFPEGEDVMLADDEHCYLFPGDLNWSIYEYEKAHENDKFVFVKVGDTKPTGIVGSGYFRSDPYVGEDWSGQGREVYYMDLEWEAVIKPMSDKILKAEVLAEAIPEVNWSTGHAGIEVTPEIAAKIEAVWNGHLSKVL